MREFIKEILKNKPKTEKELLSLKRLAAKASGRSVLRNSEISREYFRLLSEGKIKTDENLEKLLRKRSIRTLSGVAPVAVLTKPWDCPGHCAFCPTEKNVPKSYLSNEPAVMRAIRNKYNPYEQVSGRLEALLVNGHHPEKIELIVIGGTWSVLPQAYKYWFIKECFRAANDFKLKAKSKKLKTKEEKNINKIKEELAAEQKKNEKAKYKIIGITLETRPDYVNEKELIEMRELGATRVELGVQAVDDKILKLNRRGHGVAEIAAATAQLKDFGFKVTYHLMPGLPGATAKKDLALFQKLFTDARFQPDQIKFYPTVVTRGSLLYRWWKQGKYKPYSDKVLRQLIINCKKSVPEYVRIIRLIRDIPAESIEAGNTITNLRQVMQQEGVVCRCIRCREAGDKKAVASDLKLNIKKYPASGGMEYFISFDSRDGKTLFGFCRLRLPDTVIASATRSNPGFTSLGEIASSPRSLGAPRNDKYAFLNDSALVRELHVYGELVPMGGKKKIQHGGLGRRLLAEAETIARKNNFKEMAIISGVGVRGYYKKFGYRLKAGYSVRKLAD
jgi:elongator complex protein 3